MEVGQAASEARTDAPILVDPRVSAAKLARELSDWDDNGPTYRRRGWILLERGTHHVDVGFLARVALGGPAVVTAMTACVRIDYTNYDLWAPSVTFIEPFASEPAMPAVRALAMEADGPRDALVEGHPGTGRPFLCLPGIREYHEHPQHTGDDWLLHRTSGDGRLAVICERIWHRMVRNVVGLRVTMQALPQPLGTQLEIGVAQADPAALMQPPPKMVVDPSQMQTPAALMDDELGASTT